VFKTVMIPSKSPRFPASYAFSGTSRVIKRRFLRLPRASYAFEQFLN
jgi:hypothetical protein